MDTAEVIREPGAFPSRTRSFAIAGWASRIETRRQPGNLFASYLVQTPGERFIENFLRRNRLGGGFAPGALAGLMPGLAAFNSGAMVDAMVPSLAEAGRLATRVVTKVWAEAFEFSPGMFRASPVPLFEAGRNDSGVRSGAITAEPSAAQPLPIVWLEALEELAFALRSPTAVQYYVGAVTVACVVVWWALLNARPPDAWILLLGTVMSFLVARYAAGIAARR